MSRVGRRWGLALLVLSAALAFTLGRTRPGPWVETRLLMDTLVTLTLWGVAEEETRDVAEAAFAAIEAVDREMARIPGTPLWDLNGAGRGTVSPQLAEVLTASIRWAQLTDGSFDPTVGPLLDLWDFASGPHPPPGSGAVRNALSRVGWERLQWDPDGRRVELDGAALDFGAIGKGYALDRAADVLRLKGARDFILNAGGDLFVSGTKGKDRWRVGIQHPRDPGRLLRVVAPQQGAIVTSGDYERFFEWEGNRFHHVLDPRTGFPATECQSVTVWAPTGVDADALATAVFVLGPERGLALLERLPSVEGLVVGRGGEAFETKGFSRVAPEVRSE